ncbi:hypothetical protein Y032_0034g2932 [Ancylostoma ceylanicum]|nr:hypothetical protein Y032_0034g2932 [Ancylostoma ceylanicum]
MPIGSHCCDIIQGPYASPRPPTVNESTPSKFNIISTSVNVFTLGNLNPLQFIHSSKTSWVTEHQTKLHELLLTYEDRGEPAGRGIPGKMKKTAYFQKTSRQGYELNDASRRVIAAGDEQHHIRVNMFTGVSYSTGQYYIAYSAFLHNFY